MLLTSLRCLVRDPQVYDGGLEELGHVVMVPLYCQYFLLVYIKLKQFRQWNLCLATSLLGGAISGGKWHDDEEVNLKRKDTS